MQYEVCPKVHLYALLSALPIPIPSKTHLVVSTRRGQSLYERVGLCHHNLTRVTQPRHFCVVIPSSSPTPELWLHSLTT